MHRPSSAWRPSRAGLTLLLLSPVAACWDRPAPLAFYNGPDEHVPARAARLEFSYGAAAERVAVLASGREVRAVLASEVARGSAGTAAEGNGWRSCLAHRVEGLSVPAAGQRVVVATGADEHGALATVLRNAGNDPDPKPIPLGRLPLLGAAVGAADGSVLLFTDVDPGSSAGGAPSEPAASVFLVATDSSARRELKVAGGVLGAWSTPNGNFVAAGPSGRVVLELGAQQDPLQLPPGGPACGLTLYSGDACRFFEAGAVAAGALVGQDCLAAGSSGSAMNLADSGATDAGSIPAAIECASTWGPAVLSADGCVMASVDTSSGSLLAIGLSGPGCPVPLAPRYVARVRSSADLDDRFSLVLSPDGQFAAIRAQGSSEVPVRIINLATGVPVDTGEVQPKRIEFGCDGSSGACSLWSFHDGFSNTSPEVRAWSASGALLAYCPVTLHIAKLDVWSASEATYTAGDAPQHELGRIDVEREPHCRPLPLKTEPLCLGYLGPDQDFACSRDSDGEVLIAGWAPPTLMRGNGFSIDRRLGTKSCDDEPAKSSEQSP